MAGFRRWCKGLRRCASMERAKTVETCAKNETSRRATHPALLTNATAFTEISTRRHTVITPAVLVTPTCIVEGVTEMFEHTLGRDCEPPNHKISAVVPGQNCADGDHLSNCH